MTAIYSVYNKSGPSTQMPSVYLWNTPFFFFPENCDCCRSLMNPPTCTGISTTNYQTLLVQQRPPSSQDCLVSWDPSISQDQSLRRLWKLNSAQRESQSELCGKSLILIRDLSQLVWLLHYKHLSTFITCALEIRCLNSSAPKYHIF